MTGTISHDRSAESIEAKARWFQSLSMQQRLDLLDQFVDLALALNPHIVEDKCPHPIPGRIQVLRLTADC